MNEKNEIEKFENSISFLQHSVKANKGIELCK